MKKETRQYLPRLTFQNMFILIVSASQIWEAHTHFLGEFKQGSDTCSLLYVQLKMNIALPAPV